jgi:hypothetical protein
MLGLCRSKAARIADKVPTAASVAVCPSGTPLWKLILKQFDDLLVKVSNCRRLTLFWFVFEGCYNRILPPFLWFPAASCSGFGRTAPPSCHHRRVHDSSAVAPCPLSVW